MKILFSIVTMLLSIPALFGMESENIEDWAPSEEMTELEQNNTSYSEGKRYSLLHNLIIAEQRERQKHKEQGDEIKESSSSDYEGIDLSYYDEISGYPNCIETNDATSEEEFSSPPPKKEPAQKNSNEKTQSKKIKKRKKKDVHYKSPVITEWLDTMEDERIVINQNNSSDIPLTDE